MSLRILPESPPRMPLNLISCRLIMLPFDDFRSPAFSPLPASPFVTPPMPLVPLLDIPFNAFVLLFKSPSTVSSLFLPPIDDLLVTISTCPCLVLITLPTLFPLTILLFPPVLVSKAPLFPFVIFNICFVFSY
uniref:Uncharacterized protein n=1 Tax=Cacopsylla melanoneura TaxID=428564 RepID=A0A8D8W3G6_9HEMI